MIIKVENPGGVAFGEGSAIAIYVPGIDADDDGHVSAVGEVVETGEVVNVWNVGTDKRSRRDRSYRVMPVRPGFRPVWIGVFGGE